MAIDKVIRGEVQLATPEGAGGSGGMDAGAGDAALFDQGSGSDYALVVPVPVGSYAVFGWSASVRPTSTVDRPAGESGTMLVVKAADLTELVYRGAVGEVTGVWDAGGIGATTQSAAEHMAWPPSALPGLGYPDPWTDWQLLAVSGGGWFVPTADEGPYIFELQSFAMESLCTILDPFIWVKVAPISRGGSGDESATVLTYTSEAPGGGS